MKLTNKDHTNKILEIIEDFRRGMKIQKCYFHIDNVIIKSSIGSIYFGLGPSPDDSLTINHYAILKKEFYNKILAYITKNKIDKAITISTYYNHWAVGGYEIGFLESYKSIGFNLITKLK